MLKDILKRQIKTVADAIIAVESQPESSEEASMSTFNFESEFAEERLLWAKTIVEPVVFQNPEGPTKQVHELTLTHFPDSDNGVFIKHLESSLVSDDDRPDLSVIYIKKEVVLELIVALQKYMSLQSPSNTEPQ